ncbi:hypothetical protein L195_g062558, partial [Trifolium pratense]
MTMDLPYIVEEEEYGSPYPEHPEIKWTAALRQAASLAGFVVVNS